MADDEQTCWIAALRKRQPSAWGAVVDHHLHELYGFVFHLVGGNRALAEDLNQETWLEAIDGIDRCDASRGSFRNWLFGIARRRVALHYRRRTVAGNASPQSNPLQATDLEGGSILPEDVLEQVERTSLVRAALLVLSEDHRKALIWKYVEGLSVDAIAERMGRTAKAAESLLSRARQEMRALLRGYMTPDGNVLGAGKELSHE